jgi:misacylated tRNA(Ala) deacylase
MATEKLYLTDAYCFGNEAEVLEAAGREVVFDATCFYPGGGGQPPDSGSISIPNELEIRVESCSKTADGRIMHHLTDEAPMALAGKRCCLRLDAKRRLAIMRYHTALHVFNTVMLRAFDGWITGAGMEADYAHLDFKVENYTDEMRARLESEVNDVLSRNLPIRDYYIPEDEFRSRQDLLRTLEAAPPIENGRLRVVEITGFEAQACGGTHVKNTSEVGRLSITKVRSKGRINRRFYLALTLPHVQHPTVL